LQLGRISRFPERHEQSAKYSERVADENRQIRRRSEKNEVDNLPHDEKGREIETDDISKLYLRKIERDSISRKKKSRRLILELRLGDPRDRQ
jgi:hypothetical protein